MFQRLLAVNPRTLPAILVRMLKELEGYVRKGPSTKKRKMDDDQPGKRFNPFKGKLRPLLNLFQSWFCHDIETADLEAYELRFPVYRSLLNPLRSRVVFLTAHVNRISARRSVKDVRLFLRLIDFDSRHRSALKRALAVEPKLSGICDTLQAFAGSLDGRSRKLIRKLLER